MHIADMTMFYAPSSGGVRTYLDAKRRRLNATANIRHTLLVPGEDYTHLDDDHRVNVPAAPLPFSNGYRFPLTRGPWRRALRDVRPDLVEAGDPYTVGWAAIAGARELDIPLVAFYHSDLPTMISNRLGAWSRPVINTYIQRLYAHYDRVLAPSNVMAQRLERLGIQHVRVQPLGVDLKTFHPSLRDDSVRTELGLSEETRLLVFAGRGSQEKNLHILLEAMQKLSHQSCPPCHLLLVGSSMPTQVPDNVTVINHFCPTAEIARYFASSDALLHAGTQETFGLVVLEAMACGIPVVATRAGALAENVPEGCGMLCAPLDSDDMMRSILALFENDARAMGQRARAHVERHHDWNIVVQGVTNHYQELLGISTTARASVQHG
ncbi:alpha-1,6-mannosyltransferase [Kushneria avicenniae]|uniref:Alpha-1,6-mannosyltransferase n=1 Tax=Kushneria avicenniae TaxID=402385 RepID=A0A1I1GMQ2_9GAMM|nr:glycosyltransferase family 1 protein [Kushneria avicenniae]SFC10410.1 alpha-1,6-mannosyltransferase [Kushneria avicenniae]